VLRPFTHWAQPNFDCLALHTPGELMLQVHATARRSARPPPRRQIDELSSSSKSL
jgi:hypothetical protein